MLEFSCNQRILDNKLYQDEIMHYYAKLVLNKRRSQNKNGELVFKKHSEHPSIDGKMVSGDKILNWCKDESISLLIIDNESKFHQSRLERNRI
eukprot:UN05381